MGRTLRTVAIATLSSAMALTVMAPVAHAQDMPFCALLSAEEVSAAVGAQVAPNFGDDHSCNYAATAEDVFTFLGVTNGGTRMDIAKSLFTEGEDVTVAGQPGWLRTGDFDSYLWMDRGDGDTLSFQLLSPQSGVDPKATLEGLGALAFPRLSTLVIPTPTPVVIVQQDPELAARFPTEIGGVPVTVGTQFATPSESADEQAAVDALLATQGKTLADVSSGFAFSADPAYGIFAIRVKGADAAAFRDQFLAMSGMVQGSVTPAQVGGKDVRVATTEDQTQYIYTKDDVL